MKKHVAILAVLLCTTLSGGCAVVPALLTTGASMAVPQTASLIITAAGTVQKTVLFAADERNADDMLADKWLTIQAQAKLIAEPNVDMEASCYNGDIYLVGDYAAPSDRDRVIASLKSLKGIRSVKGVIKQRPSSLFAMVEPTIADHHAETVIEAGLIKEFNIMSTNLDVEMVQGEAVIMGVVKNREEAEHVVDVVKALRPGAKGRIKVTSLLAYQEAHESGATQANEVYALQTQKQMLADATPAIKPVQPTLKTTAPATPSSIAKSADPTLEALYAHYFPSEPSSWQKARRKVKARILALAKAEQDPRTRKELMTLSSKVLTDKQTSIELRLVKTLSTTRNPTTRNHVDRILAEIAPERTRRIQSLAMN